MSLRGPQIETLISSLDLVTNREPPDRWKGACEALLQSLMKGHDLRRIMLPLGPITALAAYLVFEVRNLDERGLILIAVAAIGTAAFLFAPTPPILSVTGLIVILVGLALSFVAQLQFYWLLAVAIALLSHFVVSRFYPALQYEHRIRSVLAYFGYPISDISRARLSLHDYP